MFKYRITPHTTTGVSPFEHLFKRKGRNRLYLLFPSSRVERRVADNQQLQRQHYGSGRSLSLQSGDPVMIRNYSTGPKWLPAVVDRQTGPLSYRCSMPNGREVKRHQDQLHTREVADSYSCAGTQPPISDRLPQKETPSEPPELRRSLRTRKPIIKLNL